jgi:hypothetical protein
MVSGKGIIGRFDGARLIFRNGAYVALTSAEARLSPLFG